MPRDYYPRRESDILAFTSNFSQRINASPELYLLTPQRAAEYAMIQQAFADAYRNYSAPSGNSSVAREVKESARIALEAATRPIVVVIKSATSIPEAQKITVGLRS